MGRRLLKFGIITLFPEMLEIIKFGVLHRAIQRKVLDIFCINPRDYADDKNKTVDDSPFGGGPGMVMMAKPLDSAICVAKEKLTTAKVIYLSPQGKQFDQALAKKIAGADALIMICGRYDGIDQRIIDEHVDEEWSLGDFVISGGELAALVMIDAIARCIPGVIGDPGSVMEDSFYNGLLKYPQYTRPENYKGRKVPQVLLSGHHGDIAKWRQKHSLGVTWSKRPDLLDKKLLSAEAQTVLNDFIKEQQ